MTGAPYVAPTYDRLAPEYDDRYSSDACRLENQQVAGWLDVDDLDQRTVIDVGCGTGLLIDLLGHRISPERYRGVDPSAGMLARFKEKHPEYAERVICERFETADLEPADMIVSLFGAPSYLDPTSVPRLTDLGDTGMIMFYRRGYLPDYEAHDQFVWQNADRCRSARLPGWTRAVWHAFEVVFRP